LGFGAGPGRIGTRERRSRRDHQPSRSQHLAGGIAVDRPARAPTPRRAAVVHRPRRVPLPSDPHRPDRSGHRRDQRRQRQRARVEDRIRDDKDTGLAKFPFKAFALNEVWLEIVLLAHDLIVWTQALCLDGELAKAEPKRLRYRLLHVGARLAFSARRAKLHLQRTWPWATSSRQRLSASKRSQPRPAEPPAASTIHHHQTFGSGPRSPLPRNAPNTRRPSRGTAPNPHHGVHQHHRDRTDTADGHPKSPPNAYRTIGARTRAG
jgi:Transposase DDE domain group 1